MSNTLINLLVIVIVVSTIALALYTYIANKKRQSGSQSNEKQFRAWLLAQSFEPEHFSFYAGTGIAMKAGDQRVAVQTREGAQFYSLSDVTALQAHQTTATARPLGAAPGVVEIRQFQRFNLDMSLKNVAAPIRILLENEDRMLQWEQRLKSAAGI